MKKLFVGLALLGVVLVSHADCVTNTIVDKNGNLTVCTTCCNNGQCYTTCM